MRHDALVMATGVNLYLFVNEKVTLKKKQNKLGTMTKVSETVLMSVPTITRLSIFPTSKCPALSCSLFECELVNFLIVT